MVKKVPRQSGVIEKSNCDQVLLIISLIGAFEKFSAFEFGSDLRLGAGNYLLIHLVASQGDQILQKGNQGSKLWTSCGHEGVDDLTVPCDLPFHKEISLSFYVHDGNSLINCGTADARLAAGILGTTRIGQKLPGYRKEVSRLVLLIPFWPRSGRWPSK